MVVHIKQTYTAVSGPINGENISHAPLMTSASLRLKLEHTYLVSSTAVNSKTCLSSTFHSNLFSLSLQDADADVRRECVLKLLIIYLGECVEDLIKEYTVCPNLFSLHDKMQL